MNDIYDIYPPVFGSIISMEYTLIFLGILIFIFSVYRFLNRKKTGKIKTLSEQQTERIDFVAELSNISDENFLESISSLFRKFLEQEKGYTNITKQTLQEIVGNGVLEKKHEDFLRKIYLEEYKGKEISKIKKQEILKELKKFFK